MPPLIRPKLQRQLQTALANPARVTRAIATSQQGGFSGQIPGVPDPTVATLSATLSTSGAITSLPVNTLSAAIAGGTVVTLTSGANTQNWTVTGAAASGDTSLAVTSQTPNFAYPSATPLTTSKASQVAIQYSTIQSYPDGTSPNGDQVAGVGHAVLNNDGNPVVVSGNLNAPASSNHTAFQDGGFAFVDAAGNHVAGYSQETGLWGFGGHIASFSDEVRSGSVTATPGANTQVDCVGGTPNSGYTGWMDLTTGEIIETGVYVSVFGVRLATVGSATSAHMFLANVFDTQELVPLSAFTETYPGWNDSGAKLQLNISEVQSLNMNDDRTYYAAAGLSIPSAVSGWAFSISLVIGRLAY